MVGVAGVMGLAGGVPPTLATAGADGTKGFAVGFRVNSLAFGFSLLLDATTLPPPGVGGVAAPGAAVADAADVAPFSPVTFAVAVGGSAAEASGIFFSCC